MPVEIQCAPRFLGLGHHARKACRQQTRKRSGSMESRFVWPSLHCSCVEVSVTATKVGRRRTSDRTNRDAARLVVEHVERQHASLLSFANVRPNLVLRRRAEGREVGRDNSELRGRRTSVQLCQAGKDLSGSARLVFNAEHWDDILEPGAETDSGRRTCSCRGAKTNMSNERRHCCVAKGGRTRRGTASAARASPQIPLLLHLEPGHLFLGRPGAPPHQTPRLDRKTGRRVHAAIRDGSKGEDQPG